MDIESVYGEQEAVLDSLKPSTKLLVKILLSRRGGDLVEAVRDWTIKKSELKGDKNVTIPR